MTIPARACSEILGGRRTSWLEWGQVGAEPVMCVHGSWGVAATFARFGERAAAHYRVVAPDLRGHGDSEWADSEDGYRPEDFAADLARLADCLGLARFHLMGLSLGGLVATEFARSHAARLRSLMLIDIAPRLPAAAARRMHAAPAYPSRFASLDAAVDWARGDPLWVGGAALREDLRGRLRQDEHGNWVWRADARFMSARTRNWWFGESADFWSPLERFDGPVALLRAGAGSLVDDQTAAELARRVARLHRIEIPAAGHSIPISTPDAFSDAALLFLREAASGGS